MPRAVSTTAAGEGEPLLFAGGLDNATKNVVIDASTVTADPANYNRRILKAGTPLTRVAGASPTGKSQYQRYTGSGTIAGILALDVEFVDGTSNSDTPRAMYFHSVVFNAAGIVDYSLYGAVMASTLNTCKFEIKL